MTLSVLQPPGFDEVRTRVGSATSLRDKNTLDEKVNPNMTSHAPVRTIPLINTGVMPRYRLAKSRPQETVRGSR